jgi:hypothetical protein
MKQIIERIKHLPTTALGLLLIALAVLHFSKIVTIQEVSDFAREIDALLIVLGIGGLAAKNWPFTATSSATTPPDEEPPATPLPDPKAPRPPEK